ncbi:MAG: nucleotide exchange factor GrpE [Deltaproteobacteria bacterium]|jgi:molecular chaperone GrpE|nr:nucleotide exchange factor GrpE [Deltaproteobacteria bacterium]
MNEKEKDFNDADDIEKELGKKLQNPNEEAIANTADLDISELPNPSDLAEAEDELKYLGNAFKNIKKEYDELNQNYLKSLADAENFRKRMNREKEESLKYSNEKLIKDLLPVLDFLDLAIGHSETYLEQDKTGNLKSFVEGVKLSYDEFVKTLKNHGVEIIETAGKTFDPNFHQVVEMVEDANQPEGKILEEKRRGYIYKERLLRPSLISISKPKNGSGGN